MEAKVYSIDGKNTKRVNLPDLLFNAEVSETALYEAVREFLANQRQGTAKVKNRGEVSGGGKKPWKQKGTGRARAGSIRSPLWVGGGTAFGPVPRDYSYRINKKIRRAAIKSALTLKAKEEKIMVIEDVNLDTPKTKIFNELIKKLNIKREDKKLIIFDKYISNLYKSVNNLEGAYSVMAHEINTYFIMTADYLIITESGLKKLGEVFTV
ncbi:MAG: 50S ribosomal protein L4 [bacterium (Candidatus Stahlbacteria) CG23_combo_of_CG06-09_8_20_14_all_34_7]|nr:MAG: 50S ribosomal protein L4 [bacterium (Candidatus Stahlbacteria) CG23_combo_of_CG06-09_8_20_14_all_34_7]